MNTRTFTLIAVGCLLCWGVAFAEEGTVWDQMKTRLESIAPQKKTTATTAVGGVRGAKDQAADSLYWKSEERMPERAEEPSPAIDETEYARFSEALQAASAGKRDEATTKFTAFLKDYPQSPLRPDAEEALKTLAAK